MKTLSNRTKSKTTIKSRPIAVNLPNATVLKVKTRTKLIIPNSFWSLYYSNRMESKEKVYGYKSRDLLLGLAMNFILFFRFEKKTHILIRSLLGCY